MFDYSVNMAITLEPPATGSLSATVPAEVWAELEAELAPVVPPRPTDEVAAGLAFVREQRRIADQAEVRLLEGVVQLAMLHQDLHPEHDVDLVIDYIGQDGVLPLAGPGAPHVSEFWLADLATTLRMSPAAAHTGSGGIRAGIPAASVLGASASRPAAGVASPQNRRGHDRALRAGGS